MTPQKQAAQIQKARDATTLLRDHARDGVPLHHFKRDPAVVAIHSALDSLEAIASALAAAQDLRQALPDAGIQDEHATPSSLSAQGETRRDMKGNEQ